MLAEHIARMWSIEEARVPIGNIIESVQQVTAEAKGNRESEANTIEKGNDFAGAGNITKASYEGGMDRKGISSAEGSAEAGGRSFSLLKSSDTETTAKAGTFGFSNGVIHTEHCDPTANGYGQAIIGISKIAGDTAAFVSAEGSSNYAAQGPRQASGSLEANAKGEITFLPNGVKATGSAASSSKASSK